VPESGCATDADCSGNTPTCSQTGKCIERGTCAADADCGGSTPICHEYFQTCQPCGVDADCSSPTPVCVPNWETTGVYCGECRIGDSSACAKGTWCISKAVISFTGGGGVCEPADCEHAPDDSACVACKHESYPGCDGEGGECTAVIDTLRACYHAADPTWDERACPILSVPSSYGCSPQGCTQELAAVDACLSGCAYVHATCGG
jgi:hypothetical protein